MIVFEFYLKEPFKTQAFEVLCDTFYKLGNLGKARKLDGVDGSCVYIISRNPQTHWVQLIADDETPTPIINAIEGKINGLCDTTFQKYTSPQHNIAPAERPRQEVGI